MSNEIKLFNYKPKQIPPFFPPENLPQKPIDELASYVFHTNRQFPQLFTRFLNWSADQIASEEQKRATEASSTPPTSKFLQIIEAKGSEKNKQEIESTLERKSSNTILFPEKIAETILHTLKEMEKAGDIPTLHSLAREGSNQLGDAYSTEVSNKNQQTEEGISLANTFLLNQVGLRAIQLALPRHFMPLREIVSRFYLDDIHPMDLQTFFRNPVYAPKVGSVMKNLMKIHKKTSPTIKHFALLPPALFNRFLSTYVNRLDLS